MYATKKEDTIYCGLVWGRGVSLNVPTNILWVLAGHPLRNMVPEMVMGIGGWSSAEGVFFVLLKGGSVARCV